MQRGSTQTEAAKRKIGAAVSATKQRQKAEVEAMRERIATLDAADTPEMPPEAVAVLEASIAKRNG